jgi:hypothetical protein
MRPLNVSWNNEQRRPISGAVVFKEREPPQCLHPLVGHKLTFG